jgi:site-specific recombinase XerD
MPLTPFEVKRFMTGLRKYRDIAILYLMIFCGLRSCEVIALEVEDIDLIDDRLLVRGKGGKERVLPMSPAVRQALIRYLNYERPECDHPKCFVAMKGQNRGRPLTSGGLRKIFRQQRRKTIKKAHPHLFRHTFATNLIQQGVSLPVVQKLLGHSDIEVTMGYVHLSLDDVSKEYHQAIKAIGPFDDHA